MNDALQLLYTDKQVDQAIKDAINTERKSTRHRIRKILFITTAIAVMFGATLRRQQFLEIEWYWVPIITVSIYVICWWLAIKIYFAKVK